MGLFLYSSALLCVLAECAAMLFSVLATCFDWMLHNLPVHYQSKEGRTPFRKPRVFHRTLQSDEIVRDSMFCCNRTLSKNLILFYGGIFLLFDVMINNAIRELGNKTLDKFGCKKA